MVQVRSCLSRALISLVIAAAVMLPWIQAALVDRLSSAAPASPSASPNSMHWAGITPLMSAAAQGDQPAVETLLAHGADVKAVDPCGRTALTFAAMFDRAELIELLLAHGADPDRRDIDGQTALDRAAEFGAQSAEVVLMNWN
jgi:ankyrin repeat protein